MVTRYKHFKVSLVAVLLFCCIAVSAIFCFMSTPAQIAHAAMSGHSSDNCMVELNQYVNKNTTSNYQKIDGVKNYYNSNGELVEKWQLIRTKKTKTQSFLVAEEVVTLADLTRDYSFTLSAGTSNGTTDIKGSMFSVGGGVGTSISIFGVEVAEIAVTGTYSEEMTNTTTNEQARTVTFTVTDVNAPGTWHMYQVVEGYEYKLMRFTRQAVKSTRKVYDSKGNYVGNETYTDHYAWKHYRTDTFQTNIGDYFTISKVK